MASVEQTHRFGDPEPPRRSWFVRNWGCVVLVIGLGGFCLCGGLISGILGIVSYSIQNSDAYAAAWQRTKDSPEVQEALGEPITDDTWFPTGNINIKNGGGNADITFHVAGPKGRATVHTRAVREDGEWTTTLLEVEVPGGKKIKLE